MVLLCARVRPGTELVVGSNGSVLPIVVFVQAQSNLTPRAQAQVFGRAVQPGRRAPAETEAPPPHACFPEGMDTTVLH